MAVHFRLRVHELGVPLKARHSQMKHYSWTVMENFSRGVHIPVFDSRNSNFKYSTSGILNNARGRMKRKISWIPLWNRTGVRICGKAFKQMSRFSGSSSTTSNILQCLPTRSLIAIHLRILLYVCHVLDTPPWFPGIRGATSNWSWPRTHTRLLIVFNSECSSKWWGTVPNSKLLLLQSSASLALCFR